jgi:hypothetical protein
LSSLKILFWMFWFFLLWYLLILWGFACTLFVIFLPILLFVLYL